MFKDKLTGKFPLVKALKRQAEKVGYRFHVPSNVADYPRYQGYEYDFTELSDLDNLYKPTGVIAESQKFAAQFFGAEETYYLVNGSSAGLTAAVWSCCCPGDKVLISRNVHRSVITGLIWSGAVPCFVPVTDFVKGIPLNINTETVKSVLAANKGFKAFVVTAPSYWGVSPDLAGLKCLAEERDMPFIVDEAHGGHFIFHDNFPPPAASCKADIWVNSAHKTLGALTPGALLHRSGKRIDNQRLKNALSMLQTSSPSYPVLASLELIRQESGAGWEEIIGLGYYARRQINDIKGFSCLGHEDLPAEFSLDPLRLTVFTRDISINGFETAVVLRDVYGIEVEMSGHDYFVVIMHRGHDGKDIDAFMEALKIIGDHYYDKGGGKVYNESYPLPELALSPREATESRWKEVSLQEACGCVAAVTVSPFPPGIPALIPGEVIRKETVERITEDYRNGYFFLGLEGEENNSLTVTVADT